VQYDPLDFSLTWISLEVAQGRHIATLWNALCIGCKESSYHISIYLYDKIYKKAAAESVFGKWASRLVPLERVVSYYIWPLGLRNVECGCLMFRTVIKFSGNKPRVAASIPRSKARIF
jgi:hypothetical protein